MKNYIVIDVRRTSANNNNVFEYQARKYAKAYRQMKKIAESLGAELKMTTGEGFRWSEFDTVVYVSSTLELTAEVKEGLVEQLKVILKDRSAFSTNGRLYEIPATIIFHKISFDDVVEINP